MYVQCEKHVLYIIVQYKEMHLPHNHKRCMDGSERGP